MVHFGRLVHLSTKISANDPKRMDSVMPVFYFHLDWRKPLIPHALGGVAPHFESGSKLPAGTSKVKQ